MTCGSKGESAPSLCVMRAKEQGVPMQNITFSSDGMGSWSTYDEAGNLLRIGYSAVDTVYQEIKRWCRNIRCRWRRRSALEPAIPPRA